MNHYDVHVKPILYIDYILFKIIKKLKIKKRKMTW